ncbi:MAG: flagellar basal-body rod protein FlgF [Gammaproteobacteria bacterium]|nr:flagellar basal-body rod protein FlgF [Gammaproteobacteria bacterium]MCW9030796.1 flagellar basal-body rod protein FlgF [Gammaproteobacteria bacterium]
MDRMLYVAMSGAKQNMLAQAINANNLANISTTGFRADLAAARSMPLYGGSGHPTRAYSMTEKPGIDFNQGAMSTTGRDLDIAVAGKGFISVQGPDGNEAYTRAGDLKTDSAGILQTGAGHIVLGESGPITIPEAAKVDIGKDGTISIVQVGEAGGSTVIDKLKLVNPDAKELKRTESGLFVLKNGDNAEQDDSVSIVSGTIETSNVNAASALVNMIELGRQFEMQIKMMKAAEENNAQAVQMMKLG